VKARFPVPLLVSIPIVFSGIKQAPPLFVIVDITLNVIVLLLEILCVRVGIYVILECSKMIILS
jgi:hypothetical protein